MRKRTIQLSERAHNGLTRYKAAHNKKTLSDALEELLEREG